MSTGRLDELVTEGRREGIDYDSSSTLELVEEMNREEATVAAAVRSASRQIAAVVDEVVDRMRRGGRLVYVGAGTSGRLAALDAVECESTFSTAPGQVTALLAGADLGSPLEQEAAEDDAEAGAGAVETAGVTAEDVVVGITASGRTPYVIGALRAASAADALTACVVSTPNSEAAAVSDHEILVVVGPEFVSGSTRLKAGTAQKLVLNTISTVAMIRLGKTFGDLMIDVAATNEKLRARARRVVELATGAGSAEVDDALEAAGGDARVAVLSLLAGLDADEARRRLAASGGNIRQALEP
jgi:N-acetylmuramic acid 6-phosphate etherase